MTTALATPATLDARSAPRGRRVAALTLLVPLASLALVFPAVGAVGAVAERLGVPVGPPLVLGTALVCCGLGGAAWARATAGALHRRAPTARLLGYGALGFGGGAALALLGLGRAEGALLAHAQAGTPVMSMRLAFGVLFTPATALVAFAAALALELATGGRRPGRTAARVAGAAALAFAAVDAAFDLAGWQVGEPGAEARFTMLVVLGAGLAAAALAAGATLGRAGSAGSATTEG